MEQFDEVELSLLLVLVQDKINWLRGKGLDNWGNGADESQIVLEEHNNLENKILNLLK